MNEIDKLKKSLYDRLDKVYERGNTNVWQNLLATLVNRIDSFFLIGADINSPNGEDVFEKSSRDEK